MNCNKATKNVTFQIDGNTINKVNEFKYLGRILNDKDDDMNALENQLTKARAVWGRMGKLLKMRADSNIGIMSIFYKVVLQTVLLYGSESWVLNQNGRDKLRSFHHRSARFLTGRYITQIDDKWIYPETKKTLELAHLLPIEEYMLKRKNTIQLYACDTAIYEECRTKQLYVKADNTLQWWDNIIYYNDSIDYNNNNNLIINDNDNNEAVNITYDPNEIELEWWTD
jgi:hypothetical protein